MSYITKVLTTPTPQNEPELGREQEQVKNNAGGYVFPVTPEIQLDRFLILGSEGGSYYATERALTIENAKNILELVKTSGQYTVQRIVELAHTRAPKIGPPLFVLAMAAAYGDPTTKQAAFNVLPQVARTASHLFQFIEYIDTMRGWGRSLKNGINNWYLYKSPADLAFQLVKYRNRNKWSHRDVLRKTHPVSATHNNLFAYLTNKNWVEEDALSIVKAYEDAKTMDNKDLIPHITTHKLTWEMLPTESLKDPKIWQTLLPHLPATALLRNLGRLTRLEVLKPLSNEASEIANKFSNADWVQRNNLHPFNILLAYYTYIRGQGFKSTMFSTKQNRNWEPVQTITDSLEIAFNHSFQNVNPTNKNIYIGLDVSGSMTESIAGTAITAREAAAALTLHITRTEPNYYVSAFSSGSKMIPMQFSARDSLQDILEKTNNLPYAGTNCALPMIDATNKKLDVDTFIVLTDSETWAGRIHPCTALRKYRTRMNKPAAKLIVVGMTSNKFSIADPTDAGMLDIVGFDSAMPQIIRDFIIN